MAEGTLDMSVVSAVEYARDATTAICSYQTSPSPADGPVRSVMLFSNLPAQELTGKTVVVSKSSMTSVALLELLFEHVWQAKPIFTLGDAELTDIAQFDDRSDARLVIGDAALVLAATGRSDVSQGRPWLRNAQLDPPLCPRPSLPPLVLHLPAPPKWWQARQVVGTRVGSLERCGAVALATLPSFLPPTAPVRPDTGTPMT